MNMRILFILAMLLAPVMAQADTKVSGMTVDSTPASTDVLYEVKNPGSTPLSRAVTIGNAVKAGLQSGNIGINQVSPAYTLDVTGTMRITGQTTIGSTLTIAGQSTLTGNVGIGTSAPAVLLQIGSGTRTAGPATAATDTVIKNAVQIDGALYNPGITVTSGNYVCFNTTTKALYVKSTCP